MLARKPHGQVKGWFCKIVGGVIIPLLPIALVVGVVEFLVMPLTSGFIPFSLLVGGLMFVTALLIRHKRLAPFAGAALIYVTLLLSPSNSESFDYETFLNTTMQVFLATVFTLLTFLLILPVSPKRRLYRVIAAVARDLRDTLRSGRPPQDPAIAQARLYDRLVRALTFLGKPIGARRALLSHLYYLGASDIALNRARVGLAAIGHSAGADDDVRPALASAGQALERRDFAAMLDDARLLLAVPGLEPRLPTQQAVSGLTDLAYQEGRQHRVTLFYKLMTG